MSEVTLILFNQSNLSILLLFMLFFWFKIIDNQINAFVFCVWCDTKSIHGKQAKIGCFIMQVWLWNGMESTR